MKYFNPNDVKSPKDYLKLISVIFDGGPESISIAKIEWEGSPAFAYRWNIARREWDDKDKINNLKICYGYPVSRSHPSWFVLPDVFDEELINMIIKKEKRRLEDVNVM